MIESRWRMNTVGEQFFRCNEFLFTFLDRKPCEKDYSCKRQNLSLGCKVRVKETKTLDRSNSLHPAIHRKCNKFLGRRYESSSPGIAAVLFPRIEQGCIECLAELSSCTFILLSLLSARRTSRLIRLTRWNFSTLFSWSCARYQIPLPPFPLLFSVTALCLVVSHAVFHIDVRPWSSLPLYPTISLSLPRTPR